MGHWIGMVLDPKSLQLMAERISGGEHGQLLALSCVVDLDGFVWARWVARSKILEPGTHMVAHVGWLETAQGLLYAAERVLVADNESWAELYGPMVSLSFVPQGSEVLTTVLDEDKAEMGSNIVPRKAWGVGIAEACQLPAAQLARACPDAAQLPEFLKILEGAQRVSQLVSHVAGSPESDAVASR